MIFPIHSVISQSFSLNSIKIIKHFQKVDISMSFAYICVQYVSSFLLELFRSVSCKKYPSCLYLTRKNEVQHSLPPCPGNIVHFQHGRDFFDVTGQDLPMTEIFLIPCHSKEWDGEQAKSQSRSCLLSVIMLSVNFFLLLNVIVLIVVVPLHHL